MAEAKKRGSRSKRSGRLSRMRSWLIALGLVGAAGGGIFVWRLSLRVDDFLAARAVSAIRVYGGSLRLRPGLDVEGLHLAERLRRLGYEEAESGALEPGHFRRGPQRFEVAIRPFQDPDGNHPAETVSLDLAEGVIDAVHQGQDGAEVASVS